MNLETILYAVDKLERRMVKATLNAAERCTDIHLAIHSDGSGRIVYRWTVASLAKTLIQSTSNETYEYFDSLSDLELILHEKQIC